MSSSTVNRNLREGSWRTGPAGDFWDWTGGQFFPWSSDQITIQPLQAIAEVAPPEAETNVAVVGTEAGAR